MSISEKLKDIKQELETKTNDNDLLLIPNESSELEGEEIMLYVQKFRRISAEIVGSLL